MSDEFGSITGDTAVTYNQEYSGQFSKYRAVESFNDNGKFSLLTPQQQQHSSHNNGLIDLNHNDKLKLSAPSRLPLSKVQPSSPPSSSSSHKCPEKPCFLSNTTFHCH